MNPTIRPVDASELDQLERPDIAAEVITVGPWKPGNFVSVWKGMYESGTGHVLGLFDESRLVGALGWAELPDIYTGAAMAVEIMWWVDQELRGTPWGLRLLDTLENYAAVHHLHLIMPAPANGQANGFRALYERRGYKPVESYWLKSNGGV